MSFADGPREKTPRVLCAGIIVLDEVFRVEEFPQPDGKVQAQEIFCRQRRLRGERGGRRRAARRPRRACRPDGRPGRQRRQRRPRAGRALRENVDCSACQRIAGFATALSAIFINARGDRTIVTYRDEASSPRSAPADAEVSWRRRRHRARR